MRCRCSAGQLGRFSVPSLQDRELPQLEPELLKPLDRVLDRAARLLPRGGGRHDKGRAWPGRRDEHAVLLLVAGIELVASNKGECSGHDP